MREQSIIYEIDIPVVSGSCVVMIDGEADHVQAGDFITCRVRFNVKSRWPWHIKKIDAEPAVRKMDDVSIINVPPLPPVPLNPDRL